jgi:hypothetical protein
MSTSPFPGMDPYLEEPTRWAGVHARLITLIADTLAPLLALRYTVAIQERIYIATPDDLLMYPAIRPDVHLVRGSGEMRGDAATAVITPPLIIEPFIDEEVRERYLEIRDTRTRSVITTIEVVSPANKAPNTQGRRQFMEKRRRVMASHTHWIEIDLLRAGERPPEARGLGDYYALLRRGEDDAPYEVWNMGLRSTLPVIGVPIMSPEADVPLNLQTIVETLIERGMYAETLPYDEPVPAPALAAADAQWVAERLAAWRQTRT